MVLYSNLYSPLQNSIKRNAGCDLLFQFIITAEFSTPDKKRKFPRLLFTAPSLLSFPTSFFRLPMLTLGPGAYLLSGRLPNAIIPTVTCNYDDHWHLPIRHLILVQ